MSEQRATLASKLICMYRVDQKTGLFFKLYNSYMSCIPSSKLFSSLLQWLQKISESE